MNVTIKSDYTTRFVQTSFLAQFNEIPSKNQLVEEMSAYKHMQELLFYQCWIKQSFSLHVLSPHVTLHLLPHVYML